MSDERFTIKSTATESARQNHTKDGGKRMTEKPTAIILPSWNPDDPRFIVETCEHRIAEDREFRNNTCVYNQRLGFAYSVEEIVEVLNNMGDRIEELEKELNNE